MRCMLQQNCKTKLHWKILETPLKLFMIFSWNTLATFFNTIESSLKHLWNCLETPFELPLYTLKLPWITLKGLLKHTSILNEPPLKLHWSILETPWKLPSNTHSTSFKHYWNPLKTPLKHPSIFLEKSWKLSWNTLETSLRHPWNTFETSLKFPLKLFQINSLKSSSKCPSIFLEATLK